MKHIYLSAACARILEVHPSSFKATPEEYVNIKDVQPLIDALTSAMSLSINDPDELREYQTVLANFEAKK
jgi:hypothetical protein